MKRIALIFLSVMSLVACDNKVVPEPPIDNPENQEKKNKLSLNILVPPNSLSTYANEDASPNENRIDSLYIDLYQAPSLTPINQKGFQRSELTIVNDTVVKAEYEVDNISTGQLSVKVFANRRNPTTLSANTEVPLPLGMGNIASSFYMSGEGNLSSSAPYTGTINISRNVAKLRVRVSMNSVYIPTDLGINYGNIKVQVLQTPNSTAPFGNTPDYPGVTYIGYPEHTKYTGPNIPGELRPKDGNSINNLTYAGGQIDSLYLYENLRSSFNSSNKTIVRVTIPTTSPSEGNKSAFYDYELNTTATGNNIRRNYIYTLDIKVRGQSLDPLITLDLEPWNDVNLPVDIGGTYLTTDVSDIVFDANGKATINFCSDAQAIYFDFETFNKNNPGTTLGFDNVSIKPVGIDDTDLSLSPTGFKGGQILLDKQHCGSFSFQLVLDSFPGFPNVNFSGSICVKAGNIVKCFTFPAKDMYDAHFIVGEPILNGEPFTSATVAQDGGNSPAWLQVSTNRLYIGATQTYSGSAAPLYLHLDENLTGNTRTGSITLTNNSGTKKINISQLSAIKVGRFGYNTSTVDNIYDAGLYMERLYEFNTMPTYISTGSSFTLTNSIYNGRKAAISVFDWTQYNAPNYFNYQGTLYQAINYCAQKNRLTSTNKDTELKWYLPAQAQLMGMWISNNLADSANTNFYRTIYKADAFWSATDNGYYASEAQYVNLLFGNVGHYQKSQKSWARCVRNGSSNYYTSSSMVSINASAVYLNFSAGMPEGSYSDASKTNFGTGYENAGNNKTLYGGNGHTLRVAVRDANSSSTVQWSSTACGNYTETGATNNWRLPTQRELQAIWILQSEIKQAYSTFELLGNEYYWSATEASQTNGTNAWVVYGSVNTPGDSGNAPHRLKTEKSRVRCVREN